MAQQQADERVLKQRKQEQQAAKKRKAEVRKEGPIDKMQKKDLIEKISEVFSELPSGWDKFKRPELRAVTGAVFTSIQQQLLAGASGLDVTLLHKALVELSDKEGDDGSPPIRSPAFQKATQAARVALAAAAPTPAEGFTASAVFGSSHHLERVLLQAAVACTTLATT